MRRIAGIFGVIIVGLVAVPVASASTSLFPVQGGWSMSVFAKSDPNPLKGATKTGFTIPLYSAVSGTGEWGSSSASGKVSTSIVDTAFASTVHTAGKLDAAARCVLFGGHTGCPGDQFSSAVYAYGEARMTLTFQATGDVFYTLRATIHASGRSAAPCAAVSVGLAGDTTAEGFGVVAPVARDPDCVAARPGAMTIYHRGRVHASTVVVLTINADTSFIDPGSSRTDKLHADWDVSLQLSPDTDHDGISDVDEAKGVDVNGDGKIDVNLPWMGADPRHRDLFVQLDAMTNHQLDPAALAIVRDAYASSPAVGNPDGKPGIALHVDSGPGAFTGPGSFKTWGRESRAKVIPETPVLGSFDAAGEYDWSAFDAIKRRNLRPERRGIFRYALSIHRWGSATTNYSGITRNIPGTDLILSLGPSGEPGEGSGSTEWQAGTFMHELGHTLGLRHGGDDDVNYKPNQLSVMDYAYQGGIEVRDGAGYREVFDYAHGTSPALDENALVESAGLTFPGPDRYVIRYSCATPPLLTYRWEFADSRPIDWNCDGTTDNIGSIAADLTWDLKPATAAELTALHEANEWALIDLVAPGMGARGAPPPPGPAVPEVPFRELLQATALLTGDTVPPTVTLRRKGRRLTITVRDAGGVDSVVLRGRHFRRVLHGKRKTVYRVTLTLPKKVGHVNALAFDHVGNHRYLR
jgi:hypothetical protein